jgi:hypothetical protein
MSFCMRVLHGVSTLGWVGSIADAGYVVHVVLSEQLDNSYCLLLSRCRGAWRKDFEVV